MKIRHLILLSLLFFVSLFQTSCKNKHPNVDKFYTEKGDGDMGRLPLLKPYEAELAVKDYGWCISLKGQYAGIGICNVKKVTVLDSVILLSTGYSILDGQYVKESWHIIKPKQDFEKGFATHQLYFDYLKKHGMAREPRLHDIDSIASYFDDNDYVDWTVINKQ